MSTPIFVQVSPVLYINVDDISLVIKDADDDAKWSVKLKGGSRFAVDNAYLADFSLTLGKMVSAGKA